jgi:hypothetical protein
MTTKQSEYLSFWTALIEAGVANAEVWQRFEPKPFEWIRIPSGKASAVDYYIVVNQKFIRMELFINTKSRETNYQIYESLVTQKPEIEAAFGQALEWEQFDKTSKVMFQSGHGCYQERSDWPQLIPPAVQHFEPFWNAIQGPLEI